MNYDVLLPYGRKKIDRLISQNCYRFADGKRGRLIIFNTKFLGNVFID
jgi:hypothetical protein